MWEVLGFILKALPEVADLLEKALEAGHGDPATRVRVKDILPEKSKSAQVAEQLRLRVT